MKPITLLQAAVLLLLAVIGAYAGQSTATKSCAAQTVPVQTETSQTLCEI